MFIPGLVDVGLSGELMELSLNLLKDKGHYDDPFEGAG